MKEKGSQAGWGFWLGWVLASTVGWIVSVIMGLFMCGLSRDLLGDWSCNLAWGIVIGIGVGVMQWLVLRRRVSGVGWWVLASAAAGYGIMQGVPFVLSLSLSFGLLLRFTGVAALGGAVTGILQWLVLRGKVSRAGWWVLASTVGWGLCMAVMVAGMEAVGAVYGSLRMVGSGAVLGAVTGGALVWLLRQPVPEAQLE
jgi:hypothetical protein